MRLFQRLLHHPQIEDQLVGIGVSRTRPTDILTLDAGACGVELAQHEREELAVRLAGIARADRIRFAACLERAAELGAELRGHRQRALGDGQRLGERNDALAVMAERGERIQPQRPARDLGGDPGVAVAVAADPRAELEERRQLEARAGIMLGEREIEQAEHFRRLLEQRLVEEMQAPQHFVLDGGLFEMQLARHPDELDLVAQIVEQLVGARARSSARLRARAAADRCGDISRAP